MKNGKFVVARDDDKVFEKTFVHSESFWQRNRETIKLSTLIICMILAGVSALCLPAALSEGPVVLAWILGFVLVICLFVAGAIYESTTIKVPEGHVLVYSKGRNIRVLRSGKLRGFKMATFVPIKSLTFTIERLGEQALLFDDIKEAEAEIIYESRVKDDGCSVIDMALRLGPSLMKNSDPLGELHNLFEERVVSAVRVVCARNALDEVLRDKELLARMEREVVAQLNEDIEPMGVLIEDVSISILREVATEKNKGFRAAHAKKSAKPVGS